MTTSMGHMGHGYLPALFWTRPYPESNVSTLQIAEELVKQQQAVYKAESVDEDVCRISSPTILPVLILNAKLHASPAPR